MLEIECSHQDDAYDVARNIGVDRERHDKVVATLVRQK